jgi:hypothetical protein
LSLFKYASPFHPRAFRRKSTNRTGPTQEDPYKLVILAKDAHKVCVTAADFFFADEQLSIVTCDEEGAVRMYAYDPESKRGRILTLSLSPHHPRLLVFASLRFRVEQRTKVAMSNGIPWSIGLPFLRDNRTSDERRGHGRSSSQIDMR